MFLKIISIVGIVLVAFVLVGMGMALANRYNRIAWDKYYEGAAVPSTGIKQPQSRGVRPR